MYCQKCGTQNDDNAYRCVKCGNPLQPASVAPVAVQTLPNYLAQSILVTLLCCLPFGIPAIVFAAQVNGKLQAGDVQGAMVASQKAKTWCWASFGVGLVVQLVYVIFMVMAGMAGAMSN